MMDLDREIRLFRLLQTRRQFFGRTAAGIGTVALASLLNRQAAGGGRPGGNPGDLVRGASHFAPSAKRVIYLFQSGASSQMDLLDYKPKLRKLHKTELPASIRMGQRLTGMTAGQKSFPVAASLFEFAQHGQSGAWVSDLLPHTAGIVDDIAIVKTVYTEAINHDPAITFIQTGRQAPGLPSMGAWLSYGLGSESSDLPSFVVLISKGRSESQPLFSRLWGSGFLPTEHQGVRFRSSGDPVLYLNNPAGVSSGARRHMLDSLAELNRIKHEQYGDPEIASRIAQYEMAYRMQTSVPELTDLSDQPQHIFEMYGPDSREPGTYAANCLLARRLAERGVRFIQLYHRGWDQHLTLPSDLKKQCKDTDQPTAALLSDLKNRGMLDDTLIIWGGEFGRTVYCQGKLTADDYGRDHHPRCFTVWLAGGGIKRGLSYGTTDDYCYNIEDKPIHVHDLNATILHCLGIDHERLTYRFRGRDFRLTDVHGEVVHVILA